MKSIKQIKTTIAIINVAPNKKNPDYWEDSVEYNLFYVENNEEYNFVLSKLPQSITDIVITGGHGSKDGKKLGKINVIQNINTDGKKNFYFPDCNIGKNTNELQKAYGSENSIFAKKNKTIGNDVLIFLWEIHKKTFMSSEELQTKFYNIGECE